MKYKIARTYSIITTVKSVLSEDFDCEGKPFKWPDVTGGLSWQVQFSPNWQIHVVTMWHFVTGWSVVAIS